MGRLRGRPVILPLTAVADSIGMFKANLYAASHSGRKSNNPISRDKQAALTGVPERTQRHYCAVAGVDRQENIALGQTYTPERAQEAAWQHGTASFKFTDKNGRHGRAGQSYLARQLPSTHTGPHRTAAPGRQRKINQKLKILVTKGTQGNGSGQIDKLFFANGRAAAMVFNRDAAIGRCWIAGRAGRFGLWQTIAGRQ